MQPISDKLVLFIDHEILGFSSYGLVQKWGYIWYFPMYFVWSHTQIEQSAPHHFSLSYQSVLARAAMRGDFWMVILHVNRLLNGQLLGHPWTCWGWWDPCSSGSHSIHRTTLPAFWNQHFA